MTDYIFAKKKQQVSVWWLVLVIVVCLGIVGRMEKADYIHRQELVALQGQYKALQGKSYHLWEMDSSCSDQLMNAQDGILRIKTRKEN